MQEKNVLLKIKPRFRIIYEICHRGSILLLLLILMLIPSIIYKTLIVYLISIGIIAVVMGVVLLFARQRYESTEYEFYEDKLIFNSNFINVENKYIKYENVKEIKYVQSLLQTFFNLGDIIINTNAENGINNGITIHNIEDVKTVYDKLNSIV